MKIAFATIYDARDVNRGSGWPYFLTRALQQQGHIVHLIGPVPVQFPLPTRVFRYLSVRVWKRKYRSYQDPFVAKVIGAVVSDKLRNINYDVLLTNDYSIASATTTSRPVVIYTDAMFPYRYSANINPRLANLSPISVFFCQTIQRRGLVRADLCVFPSISSLQEAKKYLCRVDNSRLKIIPWGANVGDPTSLPTQQRSFDRIRRKGVIELLFLGKDWERKGGDLVVDVTERLISHGIRSRLHIVGCEPNCEFSRDLVTVHGFLDKRNPAEMEKLATVFRQCDVLILPSVAEGYGLAYVEAAAYGLPSLAYATNGVSTAVLDGKSGILFPINAGINSFADAIESWYENPSAYDILVRGARQHFEDDANWVVTARRLSKLLRKVVSEELSK